MHLIVYVVIGCGVVLSLSGGEESASTGSSHCFKRIAGGERLVGYDVTRIIERSSVGECEEECNVYRCTHFSFGNATDGNGTCELTTDREISRRQDPNFDLYQKTTECAEGKPTGYEKACYRRIITGKRLHERFIRHSLPCNSLQACQHQCSIEKHFTCQGFNIRLDPARVGRGICELSSIDTAHLDPSRDFVFAPEFAYYERDHDNGLPNCGPFAHVPNVIPPHAPEENTIGYRPSGGPYYGGDSYGPWGSGHGTIEHGPWGSHGYGSGFFEPNDPSRPPAPSFDPATTHRGPYSDYSHSYGYGYGYGGGSQSFGFHGTGQTGSSGPSKRPTPSFFPSPALPQGPYPGHEYRGGPPTQGSHDLPPPPRDPAPSFRPNFPFLPGPHGFGTGRPSPEHGPPRPDHQGDGPSWGSTTYPAGDRRYDKPNRVPTYIIIDADVGPGIGGAGPKYPTYRPSAGYLPSLPPERPPPPRPPSRPPPRPPSRPPPRPPSRPPPRPPPPPPRQPHPPHAFPGLDKPFGISSSTIPPEVCFRREHPGYKLNPATIKGMYNTPTVLDCEALCTNSPFKCTGYSFRYSSVGGGPNCLLTDYTALDPQTHLLPDRSCDVYFRMGTCVEFDRSADTECFLKVASNRKLHPSKLVQVVTVAGMSDCELACLSSGFFTCRSFSFRHGPPIIGEPVENCFLSDWPMSALTHLDLVPAANQEVYERGSFGHGCELDVGPAHIGPKPPFTPYPNIPQISFEKGVWSVEETWRHFTVSGWPCRSGTECELNPLAGFWTCEVEGGDHAQWDYCCRPKHSCGFSRGYQYPWCYVGEAGPDQWRPCSEFYYPEFGNRYPYKPVQSHTPHPLHSFGPPRDTRPWNFGSEEFGPPSPWPISYIYAEPPPNETYVWDPEENLFYHDDGGPDHSPRIRFKPCGHRHPYPRAIVQKLDFKDIPKAANPEEQSRKDDKPKSPPDPAPEKGLAPGLSPDNREKKNSLGFSSSTGYPPGNATERARDSESNKTKEVIKTVEKIIMESSAGAEPEKNESLKQVETKYPDFFSLSLLEQPNVWR